MIRLIFLGLILCAFFPLTLWWMNVYGPLDFPWRPSQIDMRKSFALQPEEISHSLGGCERCDTLVYVGPVYKESCSSFKNGYNCSFYLRERPKGSDLSGYIAKHAFFEKHNGKWIVSGIQDGISP